MFATIDIGTNSVLLLIGEPMPDGSVRVIEDRAVVTRLGEGMHASGVISDKAAERTLDALLSFWGLCTKHSVKSIAAIGTAALRDAKNSQDFLLIVKKATGLDIEMISSEREARLTFAASAHDFGSDIVLIDIGGGSTEFVSSDKIVSLPTGCVSLTEKFLSSDPETEEEILALRNHVRSILKIDVDPAMFARPHDREFVAVAGTATTLMSMHLRLDVYDAAKVHGERLKIDELRNLIDEMKGRTIDERKKMKGLIPERADVILSGAELLYEAMSWLGYATVKVSDRGVKWGLFYERYSMLSS